MRSPFQVATCCEVGNTIFKHDLSTTELQVGCVDFATKNLIKGRGTCENDGLAFNLDCALAKTDEISAYANGAGSDESDGEDVVISARGLASDETRTFQRFNTETILKANNVGNLVATFATILDFLRPDSTSELGIELQVVFVCKVQVVKTLLWVGFIDPRCRE